MNNHDEKYRQLGLNISYYRKLRGFSQEKLAEMIPMSRGHLSCIEAPNMTSSFSIALLFDIADALDIEVKDLFDFKLINKNTE